MMWRLLIRAAMLTKSAASKFFRAGGPARKAGTWFWKLLEVSATSYAVYDMFSGGDDESTESSGTNVIPPIILEVLIKRKDIRFYRQVSTGFSRAGLTLMSCAGQSEQITGAMFSAFSEYIDTFLSMGRTSASSPGELRKRLLAVTMMDVDSTDGLVSYPDPDDPSKMSSAPVSDFTDEIKDFLNSSEMEEVFKTDDGFLIYDCFVFLRESLEELVSK